MPWDDDLLPEQRVAAGHIGTHARLLAGPGTGKTRSLTKRICFLIDEQGLSPEKILALTFTRAAAHELRQRVRSEVGDERVSRISTLHSFALRQLLLNSSRLSDLPQPLRIADDWEERNIILEDIKSLLNLGRIRDAMGLLNGLSSDWQSLTADDDDWENRFPDPAFLGAWQEHRRIYGYVLRAELVYQLKRALERHEDFVIEGPPQHLLVDEYQDLNRWDLAVIKAISDKGTEIYSAGDDDQSIYGFRKAHPQGIRRFLEDYPGAQPLELEICKRCDEEILNLGLFVARQDYERLDKPLRADDGRTGGQVELLRFLDQDEEAQSVAALCRNLIGDRSIPAGKILILLRSDRNGAFSKVLAQALSNASVPANISTEDANPLNRPSGRQVLSILRLLSNQDDHLAWRSLLMLRSNRIGNNAVSAVYELARSRGVTWIEAIRIISDDPSAVSIRFGNQIKLEFDTIQRLLSELQPNFELENWEAPEIVKEAIVDLVNRLVPLEEQRQSIIHEINVTISSFESRSISDLVQAMEVSREEIEQELDQDKVNILTMHKAKGLTADAVIVVATEDEYIPGRAQGDSIGDERRLLYVSLTRAKHHLFITYCQERTGQQRHSGRSSGRSRRNLSRFLSDGPITPRSGVVFIRALQGESA